MHAVIMAGGIGSRFWPRSRRERPKQLLDIVGEQSMIRQTYERLKKITDANKIYIVAGSNLKIPILAELNDFPEKNYITEPSGMNTAPCIGLAAGIIHEKDPNAIMGVFPADHLIHDVEGFKKSVKRGMAIAKDHVSLVTFGISPTFPATGYGYIQFDKSAPLSDDKVYKVRTFAEKPNVPTAVRFLSTGEFLWNSGMFVWKTENILNAIKYHLPDLSEALEVIVKTIGSDKYKCTLKKQWAMIHSNSIDYGIMEKSKNVYVVKSEFDWSDVGSWRAVYDMKDKDDAGNILEGNVETIDTENCFIHSKKHLVAAIGVKDLVVVQSKGAVLITHKDETEKVKEMVDLLKSREKEDYL